MKQHWKPGTLESPLPAVMVSCGRGEDANILTVAWTGIVCSHPAKLYISVRPERHSHAILKKEREFTVNLTTRELVRAADTCGVVSGAKVNKFELCRLDPEPGTTVSCPGISQSPLQIECRVTDVIPLGSHDMFLADITGINVDEELLDDKGALHLDWADLVSYSHGTYYTLGKALGIFGFSVRKKRAKN